MKPEAIQCPACGEKSFLKREPIYEGFKKTGEILSCVACRHVFDNESQAPFLEINKPVFSDVEQTAPPEIFDDAEIGRCCRHCEHYVVNPFIQRCTLLQREVEATDDCDQFTRRSF